MRLLGREHIRRIKNCRPSQLDGAELRAVCKMAELYRQHVRHNERRKRQVKRTAHSKNQYMSIEEARKVWEILSSRAENDRKRGLKLSRAIANELIFLLMTEAGLRVQEVCDLTFEGSPVEHEGCYLDFVGKGNKQRIVTISDELFGRLTDYGQARRRTLGGRYRDDLPLLANEKGGAFNRDAIYRRMKRIGCKAGIMRTGSERAGRSSALTSAGTHRRSGCSIPAIRWSWSKTSWAIRVSTQRAYTHGLWAQAENRMSSDFITGFSAMGTAKMSNSAHKILGRWTEIRKCLSDKG